MYGKQFKDSRQGGNKVSPEKVRTGSGATSPSGSEVYSEEDYEPSSKDHQEETRPLLMTHARGGGTVC